MFSWVAKFLDRKPMAEPAPKTPENFHKMEYQQYLNEVREHSVKIVNNNRYANVQVSSTANTYIRPAASSTVMGVQTRRNTGRTSSNRDDDTPILDNFPIYVAAAMAYQSSDDRSSSYSSSTSDSSSSSSSSDGGGGGGD
jgi:uncharacterized membrane protein YgcG